LKQFEVHSAQRVALNAAQLRRFGAAEPLTITEACDAPKGATNKLPVNSTGKSLITTGERRAAGRMPATRTQDVCAPFAPQKENQCQES